MVTDDDFEPAKAIAMLDMGLVVATSAILVRRGVRGKLLCESEDG
jgi:hypothetical protein